VALDRIWVSSLSESGEMKERLVTQMETSIVPFVPVYNQDNLPLFMAVMGLRWRLLAVSTSSVHWQCLLAALTTGAVFSNHWEARGIKRTI